MHGRDRRIQEIIRQEQNGTIFSRFSISINVRDREFLRVPAQLRAVTDTRFQPRAPLLRAAPAAPAQRPLTAQPSPPGLRNLPQIPHQRLPSHDGRSPGSAANPSLATIAMYNMAARRDAPQPPAGKRERRCGDGAAPAVMPL